MIGRFAFTLAALAGLCATPAFATGDIVCGGEGASVDMLVGRLPVLSIVRVVVTVGDKTWSSDQSFAPGTQITVGQGFEDDRMLVVDLTDDAVSEVIGRLRVFSLDEGEHYASGGVFSMKGEGAWLVDCSLRG